MSSVPDLTAAERRVLEASGTLVDLREGKPDIDDPARGRHWDAERTVRASFLRDLLVRASQQGPSGITGALQLRGARVIGALDLEHQELPCPVLLQDCSFAEPVNLSQARAADVRLPGCHLPSLRAEQLEVHGNLILDGLTATSVNFHSASIAGIVSLDGAVLTNPGGTTLSAGRVTVGQSMSCGSGFTSTGMIFLIGAKISHSLSFTGATLTNTSAKQWALNAQGMNVNYVLFLGSSLSDPGGFTAAGGLRLVGARIDGFMCCWDAHITGLKTENRTYWAIAAQGLTVTENLLLNRRFTADGEIDLNNARIGEEINLEGATLTNSQGRALSADRLVTGGRVLCSNGFNAHGTVSMAESKLSGSLDFTGALLGEPANNTLNLQDMTATALITRWAAPPNLVDLRHASVSLLADDPTSWPERLNLDGLTYDDLTDMPARNRLGWIHRSVQYSPQPYEQLAAYYRRLGHDDQARRVMLAKLRQRRRQRPWWTRWWGWLQDALAGYGYAPGRALLLLAAAFIAGWLVFSARHPVPVGPGPHSAFNAALYTLDVLIPAPALGQASDFDPQGTGLAVAAGLHILGWLLAITIIAAVSRSFSRN